MLRQAIQAAKDADVGIYILALGQVNMGVLQSLANETSGKVAYTYTADELADLYQTVSEQRDYIYTLEYNAPDLTDTNALTLRMTSDRSNKAEVSYGPLLSATIKSWWTRGMNLWDDIREAY